MDLKYVFGTSGDILQVLGRAARDCLAEGRKDRLQHRLRDTFGTKLADGGVPLDRIQTLWVQDGVHDAVISALPDSLSPQRAAQ